MIKFNIKKIKIFNFSKFGLGSRRLFWSKPTYLGPVLPEHEQAVLRHRYTYLTAKMQARYLANSLVTYGKRYTLELVLRQKFKIAHYKLVAEIAKDQIALFFCTYLKDELSENFSTVFVSVKSAEWYYLMHKFQGIGLAHSASEKQILAGG